MGSADPYTAIWISDITLNRDTDADPASARPVVRRTLTQPCAVRNHRSTVLQGTLQLRTGRVRPHTRTALQESVYFVTVRAPEYQTPYLRPNPSANNPRLLQLRDLSLHCPVLERPRRGRRAPLKPKRRGDLLRVECPERLERCVLKHLPPQLTSSHRVTPAIQPALPATTQQTVYRTTPARNMLRSCSQSFTVRVCDGSGIEPGGKAARH